MAGPADYYGKVDTSRALGAWVLVKEEAPTNSNLIITPENALLQSGMVHSIGDKCEAGYLKEGDRVHFRLAHFKMIDRETREELFLVKEEELFSYEPIG